MTKYDIEVTTTLIDESKRRTLFNDVMSFCDVSEDVRSFFADSCKQAVFEIMRMPQIIGEMGYTLQFRTVVKYAGTQTVKSDSQKKSVVGMDQAGIEAFEAFAIKELAEARRLINAERVGVPAKTKPRSFLSTLWKLWGE
jgi:hypothetical protein